MTKFDTDKPYKVFGDVLREILDRHGLSATRISAKIHEPKDMFRADSTISKYRTGERRPPKEWIDVLQRYSIVLFCLGLSIYTARRSIGLWLTCGYRRLCFLSSSTSRFVSPFPITD